MSEAANFEVADLAADIYVRPAHRGAGLARRMIDRLLQDARALGMKRLMLESAPFMAEAHALYLGTGFTDRGPYGGMEVPEPLQHGWRFMELDLGA